MTLKVKILTLYPQMFPGFLGDSLAGKALKQNIWQLQVINIRDFAQDKHKNVDDTPAGGGAGMVMRPDVLSLAIDTSCSATPKLADHPSQEPGEPDNMSLIAQTTAKDLTDASSTKSCYLMSPRGVKFNQAMALEMSKMSELIFVCGRFEGVDERVIKSRNLQEISIGDYILSGGEAAVFVILDAIIRLLPGTMGNKDSATHESFTDYLLEYPQYTRPRVFENMSIPDVLLSGNHQAIEDWRHQESINITKKRRPDLYKQYEALIKFKK